MGRPQSELTAFLRRRRADVAPDRVGLAPHGRRRVRGLRREEVAELAGISATWYVRFETGRARLSVGALQRVADALLLDAAQRRHLIALARPDLAAIGAARADDAYRGVGAPLDGLRDFVRTCTSCTSIAELAAGAAEAVRRMCGRDSLGYLRAFARADDELRIVGAAGFGVEALYGHRQPCAPVHYAMEYFARGRPYAEADLLASPCVDLRTRVERVGVRAYHSHPIMHAHGLDGVLGVAFREVRLPDAWQVSALETTAAIAELALVGARGLLETR